MKSQRQRSFAAAAAAAGDGAPAVDPALTRSSSLFPRYQVAIIPPIADRPRKLREIRALGTY